MAGGVGERVAVDAAAAENDGARPSEADDVGVRMSRAGRRGDDKEKGADEGTEEDTETEEGDMAAASAAREAAEAGDAEGWDGVREATMADARTGDAAEEAITEVDAEEDIEEAEEEEEEEEAEEEAEVEAEEETGALNRVKGARVRGLGVGTHHNSARPRCSAASVRRSVRCAGSAPGLSSWAEGPGVLRKRTTSERRNGSRGRAKRGGAIGRRIRSR